MVLNLNQNFLPRVLFFTCSLLY
uniref:Uncharacterized protein n=1 Tax=Rhizophora mucronata TaxID=61149 RepID=A0A2P2MZH3_RHIMU